MCPNHTPTSRHWDGSPHTIPPRRSLHVAPHSPSRLLRHGQSGICRRCGHRIDIYPRPDQRPIALHPAELTTQSVLAASRWHLSSGIAHPHDDGSDWCRIPHAALCPARTPHCQASPHLDALRRHLAVRTRRLIDTGHLTPTTLAPDTLPAATDHPTPRPVVNMLLGRYLADGPLQHIRCVAQTRHRQRCPQPVLNPASPAGTWRLLPTGPHRRQLPLTATLMAVYDLGSLPHTEQRRWRTQHCPAHAALTAAADLTVTTWQIFDPLRHTAHIHARLPHPTASRRRQG
ncbi:hypothetical protein C6376_40920 [Streptomyces sp. P3]|uniref:DUF6083 domain-containing protein n=1 Tax=Streptomyces sp. P3 TaxID=2135430 RepID=UPI000D1A9EB9|nr:DUF6083 domain-containing protein [Streptomyces sp. P3]AVV46758.1 hypothetical protein C6376_40920 [Streptomyces sp. P3]